jgi:hypothetical protein
MTFDIPKEKWSEFLNDFSKRRFGWETTIEVIGEEIGDQMLSKGMPLSGVAFDGKKAPGEIEILTCNAKVHQTHTIAAPVSVSYLNEESGYRGILEIEEASGVKTLVRILNPMPMFVGYDAYRIAAAR